MMKFLLILSSFIARNSLVASTGCLGLDQACDHDCDCCGHPDNQAIRCVSTNHDQKRCFDARKHTSPCERDQQCLSQKCTNGICVPRRPKVVVNQDMIALGFKNNEVEVEAGASASCVCEREEDDSPSSAIDGNLSTDYTIYQSHFPAIIVEPIITSPLRTVGICSSSQDPADDPLCFRLAGWDEGASAYTWIKHGHIPFTEARQDCKTVTIPGRVHYHKYKVQLGCRRGGYSSECNSQEISQVSCDPGKAHCSAVVPMGVAPNCDLDAEDGTDAFSPFHIHSIDYNIGSHVTVYTYSFQNKIGDDEYFPDLSLAVLQYSGACCIDRVRIYDTEDGVEENNHFVRDSGGDHEQDPHQDVCMSGIHIPGLTEAKTFYIEIVVKGKFTTTTMVDYALKGGSYVKYAQVEGPQCTCPVHMVQQQRLAALDNKRTFRGLPSYTRKAAECVDKSLSISELQMYGKENEGR